MKCVDICQDCQGFVGETWRTEGLDMDNEESYIKIDTFIYRLTFLVNSDLRRQFCERGKGTDSSRFLCSGIVRCYSFLLSLPHSVTEKLLYFEMPTLFKRQFRNNVSSSLTNSLVTRKGWLGSRVLDGQESLGQCHILIGLLTLWQLGSFRGEQVDSVVGPLLSKSDE